MQQLDRALDEGGVVGAVAQEGLGSAHAPAGAGGEHEAADVRGPAVDGGRWRCALGVTHMRNVPAVVG
ncbi:hypothetical protein GCM10009817_16800 [Terrabacter lapilli]|uniref:Uncharacterized protein n=1 Tax=Terrabacter lapilli TaxID=436231 RepID=A0ABN2RY99_9MICO